jgi:zinc protease
VSVDRSRLPAPGPDPPFRFPRGTTSRLASGLTLRTVEHRDVPVLVLALTLPAGSAHDPGQRPGLAALTADLADEGSGDLDAIGIHEALARIGAQLDTETGYDTTRLTLTTLSRFHREAVGLLADIAFRPSLTEADFARVRDLRCHRLVQLGDVPAALAERSFATHVFAGHPYGHLPIGTAPALRAASADEARAFHAARYRPERATLVAVGAVTHEEIAGAADEAIARLGAARATAAAAWEEVPDPPPASGLRLVLVDRPGAPQSELRVGHAAARRSTPDYHALVVLNAILGGQFVSRLNLKLREEKGYTYGVRSAFDWRRGPGPFIVQTSVQTDATAAAAAEILREIEEVATVRPPAAHELELARASLTRGYARSFETAEQIARAIVQLVVHELPDDHFDEFVPKVRAVDAGAVVDAARRHLRPAGAHVVVVGDRARVEPALGELGAVERIADEPRM